MKTKRLAIEGIPMVFWGEESKKVFIAVHGNMSNKEDEVIKILADVVTKKGYQVISFDLPEHGERKDDASVLCKVQNCVDELKKVLKYAKENFDEINLWACSMGAYFSLVACKEENINKCIFLSPVVNMKVIIENMMKWANVTENQLREAKEIKTSFGVVLYYDYYSYVKENPILSWNIMTYILYGDKDNMQEQSIIQEFTNKFNCELTILGNGEHYFHTKEQLEFYRNWLLKIIEL